MTETLPQYSGGERVRAAAAEDSTNPSNTPDVVAHVPRGGEGRDEKTTHPKSSCPLSPFVSSGVETP